MYKARLLEILIFILVGAITFALDYGLLYFFTEFFGLYYLYSNFIAFTVAVLVNYCLCIIFVFKNAKRQNSKRMIIFIGSSVVGLFLNQLCMWLFVDVLTMYYLIAKVFATAIVMIWNYIMKRKAVVGD